MFTLEELVTKASQTKDNIVAVAAAADIEVLKSIDLAIKNGIAQFNLYDNEEKLRKLIESNFPHLIDHPLISLFHAKDLPTAAQLSVKSVFQNEANVLMKGHIPTSIFLKAVLHPEFGLRSGKVLSHVAAFEITKFDKLIFVTDAAMNIAPDLEQKAQIIQNAVKVARSVGVSIPNVAVLTAVETVNSAMQPTIDAAALTVMNKRGQINNCTVEGPLALDNAISREAAQHKGITGTTAGQADILLVPNIEAGNILYKSLIYFAKAKVGAIIEGATAPIVLTSRSDQADTKLFSLALAICVAKNKA